MWVVIPLKVYSTVVFFNITYILNIKRIHNIISLKRTVAPRLKTRTILYYSNRHKRNIYIRKNAHWHRLFHIQIQEKYLKKY